ncbi:MAG: hypothetical protein E7598_03210 [Ruminococcaceae bacterium]|nr:hypothetical protein [Oscillospiraceae bacterium]
MVVCEIVTSYGFKFYEKDSGDEVCSVSDVFTDADKAEGFKILVNESGIDASHIKDIIEDMISI